MYPGLGTLAQSASKGQFFLSKSAKGGYLQETFPAQGAESRRDQGGDFGAPEFLNPFRQEKGIGIQSHTGVRQRGVVMILQKP